MGGVNSVMDYARLRPREYDFKFRLHPDASSFEKQGNVFVSHIFLKIVKVLTIIIPTKMSGWFMNMGLVFILDGVLYLQPLPMGSCF